MTATADRTTAAGPSAGEEPEPQPARPDTSDEQEEVGAPAGTVDGPAAGTALRLIGTVLASTTLLTALMYYFGFLHAYWFGRYFGVNSTALDLTAADYLLRSVDGLFTPLIAAAALGVVIIWLYRLIEGRVAVGSWAEQAVTVAAATLGSVALGVATAAVLDPFSFSRVLAVPGICLVVGVLLVAWASRRYRHSVERDGRPPMAPVVAVAEWAAVFVLVAVGLFWSAGDYSARVGTTRGIQMAAQLPTEPDVTVYSAASLSVDTATAVETACRSDATYAFRYDGLKLVFATAGHYFLVPADWTRSTGAALVVPRSEGLRLEFTAPGAARGGTC